MKESADRAYCSPRESRTYVAPKGTALDNLLPARITERYVCPAPRELRHGL